MIKIEVENGRCEMDVSGGSRVIAHDFLSAIITIHNRLQAHNPAQAQLFKACILLGINHKENWTKAPGPNAKLESTFVSYPHN